MEIRLLDDSFTVCKIKDMSQVDYTDVYCFVGKTDEELSLVCRTASVPPETLEREDGWRGFRIQGVLDFSLTGILSGIASLLAQNHIPLFALSTYNTDYIFTKNEHFDRAIGVLAEAGYRIVHPGLS